MAVVYSNEAQVLLDKRRLRVSNHRGEVKYSCAHFTDTTGTQTAAMIQLKYSDSVVEANSNNPNNFEIYGIGRDGKALEQLLVWPDIKTQKYAGQTLYQWLCDDTSLKPSDKFQKYLDQEDGRNSTHCWIVVQTETSKALDVEIKYVEGAPSAMSLVNISPDKP